MPEVVHEPLALNTSEVIDVDGESVLLCNSGGTHFAIRNQCTHQSSPLAGGRVRNGFISCPLHGVRFDLITGEPRGSLTRVAVQTYAIREDDGMIIVSAAETRTA
ncbi:MAG: 3-phenylpropionate/trans-cinnamate dioxygenase ferredoxin subunit [Candidatus Azotimanducaceae bacterium]|jgi:3-phenylpropionate/trans-cinnamate dioxygenase ferredoxin subunit